MKRRLASGMTAVRAPLHAPFAELPSAGNLWRSLDALEKEADLAAQAGQSRWMIPYADLLTLLLGLFLVITFSSGRSPASKPMESAPMPVRSTPPPSRVLETRLRKTLPVLPGVEIRHQERGTVLSLKENILFEPGQADLSPAACRTLDTLAGQLVKALGKTSTPIRIEGHTDNTPIATARYPSNWELSTARATNIVRYLIQGRYFSPADLSAAGYGEFRPLENNSSIEGKRKNRRVDIVILNRNTIAQEPPLQTPPSSVKRGLSRGLSGE